MNGERYDEACRVDLLRSVAGLCITRVRTKPRRHPDGGDAVGIVVVEYGVVCVVLRCDRPNGLRLSCAQHGRQRRMQGEDDAALAFRYLPDAVARDGEPPSR